MRIVLILAVIFTSFPAQSATTLITVIQMNAVSGGYVIVRAEPGALVSFRDQEVYTDSEGFAGIGFGRDIGGLYDLGVTLADGRTASESIWIASRRFNVQRIEGVDMSRVTPPASVTQRIQREAEQVWLAREGGLDLPYWREDTFIAPIQGRVTGVYGSQRYYNGLPRSPHWGIDYAAARGTPVKAPAGGVVVLAEPDLYYSGGTIILDHGGGLSSSFLHLSQLSVDVGDRIQQGDILGAVGSTGRSTGPHLDWRMNLHGERIDAALWLEETARSEPD